MADKKNQAPTDLVKQVNKVMSEVKKLMELERNAQAKALLDEKALQELKLANLEIYSTAYEKALNTINEQQHNLYTKLIQLTQNIVTAQEDLQKVATDATKVVAPANSGQGGTASRETTQPGTKSSNSGGSDKLSEVTLSADTVSLAFAGGGSFGGGNNSVPPTSSSDSSENPFADRLYEGEEIDDDRRIIDDNKRAQLADAQNPNNETNKTTDIADATAKRVLELSRLTQEAREESIANSEEAFQAAVGFQDILEADRATKRKENAEAEAEVIERMRVLRAKQHQEEKDQELAITALKLDGIQKTLEAEEKTADQINKLNAQWGYDNEGNFVDKNGNDTGVNAAGQARATMVMEAAKQAEIAKLEQERAEWIAKRELELARKNGGILTAEAATQARADAALRFKLDMDNIERKAEESQKKAADEALDKEVADEISSIKGSLSDFLKKGTLEDKRASLKDAKESFSKLWNGVDSTGEKDAEKAAVARKQLVEGALKGLENFMSGIEARMEELAKLKGPIDTRLHGSNMDKSITGSYWDKLSKDITRIGAVTPYYKRENFDSNVQTLVEKGIAFDLKQRAFLMTIQDKIATTFEATHSTLLKLVRIQQEDSTAGRLGMEASMTAFLNSMYENTEYLESVAGSVRDNLYEMEALMTGAEATEIEWQVQKWLGSLYSVGMDQTVVQSIATAIGQVGAGQIEGITGGNGIGNLVVMAANNAGLSIADILTNGLDSEQTNSLLQSAVNYLAEMANSSTDSRVVQQELAKAFGVKASDLRAATNLLATKDTIKTISNTSYTYANMLTELKSMASTMALRTSMSEMISNVKTNFEYVLASSFANNPISYFSYYMAKGLDSVGGIPLPFLNFFGSGVDLNTSVSDLLRLVSAGSAILGSIGPLASGLTSSFSSTAMLKKAGIDLDKATLPVTARGVGPTNGGIPLQSSSSLSESGMVGNGNGEDIKNSTMQGADDDKKKMMIEAEEEHKADRVDLIHSDVATAVKLLEAVVNGEKTFSVKVVGYGLTKASSGLSDTGGAIGGVAGLGASTGNSGSGSGNSALSNSISGTAYTSGWMMV